MSKPAPRVFGRSACLKAKTRLSVILISIVLVACGSVGSGTLSTSTTVSTTTTLAPQQTHVTFPVPYLPTNFNPNTPDGDSLTTREIMTNVWPSAFYQNAKYQTVLNSNFLNSAELVSTNPQEVIYQINPDATWSDGTPITAADFIYNWEAQVGDPKYVDVGGASYLANTTIGYSDIQSVAGSNNGKTVTVIFNKLFSEWESLFNPLVPAHIAKQVGWSFGFAEASPLVEVSGGAYQISTVVPGKEIELTRNTKYWGRRATIAKIVFLVDPNPSDYPAQFGNGTLNLVQSPSTDLLFSGLRGAAGVHSQLAPSLTTEELLFNLSHGPLGDLKVRQAIATAIDRKAITAAAIGSYDPTAVPAGNNIYSPGAPQYQNDGTKYVTSDPGAAEAILTSDGYVRSVTGIMTKNGQPLELTISVDSANQQLLYIEELITEELSAVGIVVNAVNYSLNTLEASVLLTGAFDMAIVAQAGSPNATYHVDHYLSGSKGARNNYTTYSNPQADALIAKASTELDPATSAKIYNQLDQLLWKDLPSIPLYSVPDVIAYNMGYNFIGTSTSSSTIFWNSSTWSFISPRTSSLKDTLKS